MTLRQQAWNALRKVTALREGKPMVHVAHAFRLASDITGKPWVMTDDDDHREILRRFGDEVAA